MSAETASACDVNKDRNKKRYADKIVERRMEETAGYIRLDENAVAAIRDDGTDEDWIAQIKEMYQWPLGMCNGRRNTLIADAIAMMKSEYAKRCPSDLGFSSSLALLNELKAMQPTRHAEIAPAMSVGA